MKWSKDIEELGTVTISIKQFEELLERDFLLEWLEQTGVDNWEGWESVYEMPSFSDFDGSIEEYREAWQSARDSSW